MRPIKLEVNNIASFHGTHAIDFTQTGGLFAITGATGAGKSSLLNSICLALYGRGPKKTLFAQDYITQGQDSGSIVFTFAHQGHIYQAHWRATCRSNKQGKITTAVKRLFFCDEAATRADAESILGLSFEQFCRTVILNQGDFAKFINASFSERRDIIERLAQAKELQFIHQLLGQELKAHEAELEHYREKMQWYEAARAYDSERAQEHLELLQQVLDHAPQSGRGLSDAGQALARCREQLQQLALTRQKIAQTKDSLNTLLKDFLPIRDAHQLSQHALHEFELEFVPKQSMLQEAIGVASQLEAIAEQMARNKSDQERLGQHQRQCLTVLEQSQKALTDKEMQQRLLQSRLGERHDWELDRIQSLWQQWQQAQRLQHQYTQELAQARQETTQISAKLAALAKDMAALTVDRDREEQCLQQIPLLEKSLAQKRQRYALENHVLQVMQESHHSASSLLQGLPELNSRIELLSKEVLLAKQERQIHELKQALALVSKHSQAEGHCLVCGSDVALNEGEQVDLQHAVEEQQLDAMELKLQKEKSARESQLALLQREHQRFSEACTQMKVTFSVLNGAELLEQGEAMDFTIDSARQTHEETWGAMILDEATLKELRQEAEQLARARHQWETLQGQRQLWLDQSQRQSEQIAQKEKFLSQYQSESRLCLEQLQAIALPLPDLAHVSWPDGVAGWQDAWATWKSGILELRQVTSGLEQLRQTASQYQREIAGLNSNQRQMSEEWAQLGGRQQITAALLAQLSPHGAPKEEWQKLQGQYQQLKEQEERQREQLSQLETKRERHRTTLSLMAEQEQSIEQMALHYQGQFEDAYQQLHQPMKIMASLGRQFQTLQLLPENMTPMPTLASKIPSFMDNLAPDSDLQEVMNGLDIFIAHYLTPQLQWQRQLLEQCQKQHQAIAIEHQRQMALKQELAAMATAMQAIESRTFALRDLDHVIGKSDFRNWALAKIEEELIALANRELEQLCQGRYRLVQEMGKNGPDFLIEDLWSCTPARKISSLSGGETFLVSLAMAMALSDMVRGQTCLESFFIDEGFGQLDPDGLEEAMGALWSIGERGKTIGIISHITDLTDRIPVNIRVDKGQRGHAHIDIIQH